MKNEAELVPYWLRHYQKIADKIIVYDHHSTDGTPDLLRGAGVEVREYEPATIDDGNWADFLSVQYREARGQAGWVIVVDADEFIYHPVSVRDELRSQFIAGNNMIIPHGYTMISPWFPAGDGQIYEYCQHGVYDPLYSKPCIFSPDLELRFVPGKHRALVAGPISRSETKLKLLHYRYFGIDWLKQRNKRNADNLSSRAAAQGWGFHVQAENTGLYSPDWYAQQRTERIIFGNPT